MLNEQAVFDRFVLRFNHSEFFEAHEELESLWTAGGLGNNALRGLIQLCAAFVHTQKGTRAGAKSLLEKSRSLLQPLRDRTPHLSRLFDKTTALLADDSIDLARVSCPSIGPALEAEMRRILGI